MISKHLHRTIILFTLHYNMSDMTKDKAYLVGTHRYFFRAGEPAEIIGVVIIHSDKHPEGVVCYEIEFSDGELDYVPIGDSGNFEIVGFKNIISGTIPKVCV